MGGCADVCVGGYDYGDESCSFYQERDVKARKIHKCNECADEIPIGMTYRRMVGAWDRQMHSFAMCSNCAEIADAFFCDGFAFGRVWYVVREELFPIWKEKGPWDCLAKLETKEARDAAMERYRKWDSGQ